MWSCGIIIIFRRLEFFIHQPGNWRLADIFQPQKVRVQDFKKNIQRHRPCCRNFCERFAKVFLCDLFVFPKIVTCDIVRWVIESRAGSLLLWSMDGKGTSCFKILPFFSSGFDDGTKISRILFGDSNSRNGRLVASEGSEFPKQPAFGLLPKWRWWNHRLCRWFLRFAEDGLHDKIAITKELTNLKHKTAKKVTLLGCPVGS